MYTSPDEFIAQASQAIVDLDLPETQPVADLPSAGLQLDAFWKAVNGLSPDHRAAIATSWVFFVDQLKSGPSREVAFACLQVVSAVLRVQTQPEPALARPTERDLAPATQIQREPVEHTGDDPEFIPTTYYRHMTPTEGMPHVERVVVPSTRLDSEPGPSRLGPWRIVVAANLVLALALLSFVLGDRRPKPVTQDITAPDPVVEMLVEARPGQNFRLTVSRATAKETPDARFLELLYGVSLPETGLVLFVEQQ